MGFRSRSRYGTGPTVVVARVGGASRPHGREIGPHSRRCPVLPARPASVLVGSALLGPRAVASSWHATVIAHSSHPSQANDKAVFFAADGMRQDPVAQVRQPGSACRRMARFLKTGTYATGNGLLTQAPPNTGAGWYSLATGAWPGVHGSTNNTFHIIGQPFANRTSAFDPNVLQVEIDRPVRRARRPQGRPGRVGRRQERDHQRSDDRLPVVLLRPRRRDELHRHGRRALFDDAPFIASFGLQFDTPGGLCRSGPVPRRRADRRHGLDGHAAALVQPGHGDAPARARLRRRQVRAERLHLRQHERPQDELRQGPVLADEERPRTPSAPSRKGEWADVKVKISGGALDGKTAGMLVKVEELTADLSRVRLFHTSVTPGHRELADAGRASRASPATSPSTSPRSSRPRRPPTSPSSRPASRARRRTSSRASTGRPATCRCSSTS